MRKLTLGEKLSFGAGAFGKDLVYGLVATFIFVYFTDVCYLAPAAVGTIFLISRIFDAVNDPIMGLIVDNTRSRIGKFKPWLIIGTLINAVVLVFLFWKWDLSPNGMIAYATITYVLWGLTYTIMDIPYWSMIPDLGSTREERNQIAAIPRLFASTAWLVIGGLGLGAISWLGGGNDADGYFYFALIIAGLFIACVGATVLRVPVGQHACGSGATRKTTLKEMLRVLFRNEMVMCVLVISVLFNLMIQMSGGLAIYFFKNVIELKELIPTFLLTGSLAQMFGIFCYPFLAKRLKRGTILMISGVCCLITSAIIFSGIEFNLFWTILASAFFGISGGLTLPAITVMLADGVDYGEAKFGMRNESIIFSTQTFVVKLASAFSAFIIGIGLDMAQYVPDVALSSYGKSVLTVMMGGVPLAAMVFFLAIYWLYYRKYTVQLPA